VLAVPRALLADDDAGEREWKSKLLLAYRRLSRRAELLIAEAYLAGVNTGLRNFCRESRLSDIVAQASAGLNLMLEGGRA
jgi:hypothetical protein